MEAPIDFFVRIDNDGWVAVVLIVEDDPSVRELLTMAVEAEHHQAVTAVSGPEALDRWRANRPDVVLLDLMLPGIDGIEVCRRIRQHDQVPIIVLTAKTDPIDMVLALEEGADDYVTKPFETRVLMARIKAVLRRSSAGHETGETQALLRIGDLEIDPNSVTVTVGGEPVELSRTEYRLLHLLAVNPGQVLERDLLLERVWEHDYLGNSRMVDVCVGRLRSKIETDPAHPVRLLTRRGFGYTLVDPTAT